MAHFVMSFAPAPAGSFNPGPWKSARGLASSTADVTVDLHIPSNFTDRLAIPKTIAFMLRFAISPAALLSALSNHPFAALKDVPDNEAIIIPFETGKRHFPLSSDCEIAPVEGLHWIKDHWRSTHDLIEQNPEFALAVAAVSTSQFVHY